MSVCWHLRDCLCMHGSSACKMPRVWLVAVSLDGMGGKGSFWDVQAVWLRSSTYCRVDGPWCGVCD